MEPFGVFVGRFCPLHAGHEIVIHKLIEQYGVNNSLVIIGSSNHPLTIKYFFTYAERRSFIKTVFPSVRLVGLPDYPTDAEWMDALDDLVILAGSDPKTVEFFGGCREEVEFFTEAKRKVKIYNRFDGTTIDVSATKVRDTLIERRPLDGMVNPAIQADITRIFEVKWEMFKRQ